MATISKWNPDGVALDITATAGTIKRISATQFTVVINASWKCYYSGGSTNYGMKVTSGGKTIYIPKFDGDSYKSSGSGTLTGTYSISGNGAQTKSVSVEFDNYKDSPVRSFKKNITLSVSVPAWTSYTVSYNANGGSGAPGNQTKWKDQTLTLSSTKPTRTGYDFKGWALSKANADAGTWYYQPGGSCGKNENLTLYAVWEANTYPVKYNANGGTGAPSAQTKTYGKTLTLSSVKPTRTNYNFKGWATSASATTATYAAGGSYIANSAITLYAVWELAYSKPRINNLSVVRCDSEGNITDDGESALVTFDWVCDKDIVEIKVTMESVTGSQHITYSVSASGTSGSASRMIGGFDDEQATLYQDLSYTIQVIVRDSIDSYSKSVTLNGQIFPIDFLAGGKGAAFGKPAERENVLDIAFVTNPIGGFENPVLASGTDLDEVRTPNVYVGENVSNDDITYPNCPLTSGTFTLEVFSSGPNGQTTQRLTGCDKNNPQVFERTFYTNAWGSWYGAWQYPTLSSNFAMYGSSTADNQARYRKDGRLVEVRGIVTPTSDIAGSTTTYPIFTLPTGYTPSSPIYVICQGSGNCIWNLSVKTNGEVGFSRYRNGDASATCAAGAWLPFQVTFFAK